MTDKTTIFLDLEDAINDLISEQNLDENLSINLMSTCAFMKRDASKPNLWEQSCTLQNLLDGLKVERGETPAVLLVQARLEQLRVLLDIRDSFNTEEAENE